MVVKWQCFSREIPNLPLLFAQDSLPQWSHGFHSHIHGEHSQNSQVSPQRTNRLCPPDHLTFPCAGTRAPQNPHVQIKPVTMASLNYVCPLLFTVIGSLTYPVVLLRNLNAVLETSISFYLYIHLVTKLCKCCLCHSILPTFVIFINSTLVHATFFSCSEWWQWSPSKSTWVHSGLLQAEWYILNGDHWFHYSPWI